MSAPARSPYWRPGMASAEPWTAVAETSTGHLVVPCGVNAEHAAAVVRRWQLLAERDGGRIDGRIVVGGAVVDPQGAVTASWALEGHRPPAVGGPPRWTRLGRSHDAAPCAGCGAPRWPGCWRGLDVPGCALCLPGREAADPRPAWPVDPPRPPEAPAKRKRATKKTDAVADEAVASAVRLDSPGEGRLI